MVAVLTTILAISIALTPSSVSGIEKIILSIIRIITITLFYLFSYLCGLWYVSIEKKQFVYRSMLEKVQMYQYKDVTRGEIDEYNNFYIYCGEKEVLALSPMVDYEILKSYLIGNKIPVTSRNSLSDFTIEQSVWSKYAAIFYMIFSIGCTIAGIYVQVGGAVVFWGVFTIVPIANFVIKRNSKIIIKEDVMYVQCLLKKQSEVKLSEITHLQNKCRDNKDYVWVYSNKGLEAKICKAYKNYNLFEQLQKNINGN